MSVRNWIRIGALSLGLAGLGWAAKSFFPASFSLDEPLASNKPTLLPASLPSVEVEFLRCGFTTAPEFLAVRGSLSFAPRAISHSAVLIRHPQATFLYDTGLSGDIYLYLENQSLYFRQVLARFTFETSLRGHLLAHNLEPRDLDFVFLSHLHWDHVSGIPDIPGVPLRVNRVEYDAARLGLLEQRHGLV
jgi:N-acyl homoserine lactone hydrolase